VGRPAGGGVSSPAPAAGPVLTARELEVAGLVARAATNREIAARLVIAEQTAMRHVEHILNKLGARERAQIAAWAAAHGLLAAP
jgi:DNA-binding NarL/FixJ family response regulator